MPSITIEDEQLVTQLELLAQRENRRVEDVLKSMIAQYTAKLNAHEPTARLILCAYPDGIPNLHYKTLLSILGKQVPLRVLATAVAQVRGSSSVTCYNDAIEAAQYHPQPEVAAQVMARLLPCGYEEWLRKNG